MLYLLPLICALIPQSRGNDYYGEYVGDFKNRFQNHDIVLKRMGSDKRFQIQYFYSFSGSMGLQGRCMQLTREPSISRASGALLPQDHQTHFPPVTMERAPMRTSMWVNGGNLRGMEST